MVSGAQGGLPKDSYNTYYRCMCMAAVLCRTPRSLQGSAKGQRRAYTRRTLPKLILGDLPHVMVYAVYMWDTGVPA